MSYNLKKFQQDNLSTGVQTYTSDFSPEFKFSIDTKNVSTGIQQGVGPRFGMAPIPAQQDTEGAASAANSVRQSEGAGSAYENRTRFFGVLPVTLGTYNDITIKKNHFVWLVGTASTVDALIGSATVGAGVYSYDPQIVAGIPPSTQNSTPILIQSPAVQNIQGSITAATPRTTVTPLVTDSTSLSCSYAAMSVTGRTIPQKWIQGRPNSLPTATNVPSINFVMATNFMVNNYSDTLLGGIPWWIENQKFPATGRTMTVYAMGQGTLAPQKPSVLYKGFKYDNFTFTAANTEPAGNQDLTVNQLAPGLSSSQQNGGLASPNAVKTYLVNCDDFVTNSSYNAVCIAKNGIPNIVVMQDWVRNQDGSLQQWFDPTKLGIWPLTQKTVVYLTTAPTVTTPYTEGGVAKETCFSIFWPWDGVTATPALSANYLYTAAYPSPIQLGAAGSGILSKTTDYELTYSLFNKRLGYETNVGTPAKFRTGADDAVALAIGRDQISAGTYAVMGTLLPIVPSVPGNDAQLPTYQFNINDYEFRFYYRQVGTFEWLPARFIDAAEYFYNPNIQICWACQGPIAALPGGQPGGFNDYSMLPQDQYDCVLGWNSRVFWSSKKNVVFSMRDNVFAYPLRNSVAAPTGEFRGMTVHAFPGQAEQRGRLVIWGSEEVYAARFTGNPQTSPVQVSANTIGEYPLDGSDFVVERWTTNTAFSYRAATVAEGILYYWGAKGIFRDNGVELPERISINIEPDLFKLYDPTQAQSIFSHYFEQSREIMWFYTPISAPTVTHAVILNILTGGIYRAEFDCKIDSICSVNIENTNDTQKYLAGKRAVLSVRHDSTASIQRPYFFDLNNRAGDLKPGHEAMVKQTAVVGNTVTLTLASGYDAATLGSIVQGDKVTIHQAAYYNGQTIDDMICTVVSVNLPTVVVTKPATATIGNWTAAARKEYFPVWFAPLTAIPYRIKSQYWCPEALGQWYRFLFAHLVFKIKLLKSSTTYDLSLGYRTPISSTSPTKTVTLTDNSDGNCQIYAPLPGENQSFEGQGIRYDIAGLHNGGEWVLQYIGNHAEPQTQGDNLLHFEA